MFKFNISFGWMFVAGVILLILLSGCAAEPIKPPPHVVIPISFNYEEIRIMIEDGGAFTIPLENGVSVTVTVDEPEEMSEAY